MRRRARTHILSLAAVLASTTAYAAPKNASRPGTEAESCSAAHVRAQVLKRDTPNKLLERRAELRTCSSTMCAGSIVEACSAWLKDLDALVPNVTVRILDSHGVTVSDASVRIDGKAEAVGVPVDVDPGAHIVVAAVATTVSRTVVVHPGEKGRVLEIVMGSSSPPTTSSRPEAQAAPKDASVDTNVASPSRPSGDTPTGAYVAFTVAGAGAATGAIFTVIAVLEKNKCPKDATHTTCPSGTDNLENDAAVKRCSWIAGFGYGVGVVGGAIGLWRFMSRRSPAAETKASERGVLVQPLLGLSWVGVAGRF